MQDTSTSPDSTLPFPLDVERLVAWMDSHHIENGPLGTVTLLAGGTQNILLRLQRGEKAFVLRRPGLHPRPDSNRIMLREARVLGALRGTVVPHPKFLASCDDASVMGVNFYLMEEVEGFNPTVDMPGRAGSDPECRFQMGMALIDALALLAKVDPEAVGLSDFGKMDGFIERQVGRWSGELESYTRYERWNGRAELGDVAGLGGWLEAQRPKQARPGIFHGDYHIGNVLYRDDATVTAILDWEMATLGDPLMDLGRVLATWPRSDGSLPVMRVTPLDGFPTREQLIARYAQQTGRDLSDLKWFEVMGCYKLGIIFEGSYARAQSGLSDLATGLRLHQQAVGLLRRARAMIDSS